MKHAKGDIRYTMAGEMVEIGHVLDETAFVHPMVKVTHQDDYGVSDEEFEPAGYLVSRNVSDLFDAPPVAAVDAEIASKRKELADAKKATAKALSALKNETKEVERQRDLAEGRLEKWKADHKHFIQLGRLLDGEPMFPLHAPDSHYHSGPNVPSIPDWKSVRFICVTPNVFRSDENWQIYLDRDSSGWTTRFFESETDRSEFVTGRFEKACAEFRKKPNYATEGGTYTTRLDYGTLERWCEKWLHLAIPKDITDAKKKADAEAKAKEAEKLREKLHALETSK